ncbi:MAG: hypothetical protein CMG66_04225 [Candidatus Marinimicrobia bacterium]|nr:hypothetical protein [Candidatus Neomarinimicrobiota bacterium]|tara:strand:- start:21713 stop:23035 length:1323 start_codon:yes stop_codon:yes gene_type:complete
MRIKIEDKENFLEIFNQIYPNNKIEKINGVSIDSRLIENNDIFIPFKGVLFDGNQFIDSVLEKKGTICLSENNRFINNNRVVSTSSNKQALSNLSQTWLQKMGSKIIAITGSNGKTTTKELLYHIIKDKYRCGKSKDNHNSTIGLPLSILNCKINDKYTVLELGANQPGEIKDLCEIVKPDLSLITNISNAHIENFKSLQDIAKTKSAIFSCLDKNGIAFVNLNDKIISNLPIKSNKVTFGFNEPKAQYNGIIINKNKLKINNFEFIVPDNISHLKEAILAVYAISKNLNVKDDEFINALKTFSVPGGRGKIKNINGLNIIDDAYNANPASMKFGIERLSSMKSNNRKILIIGDMLELGESSIDEHIKIGSLINSLDIDIVLTFGDTTQFTFKELNNNFIYKKHFTDIKHLKKCFNETVKQDDLIYIKGSRSMELERVYN